MVTRGGEPVRELEPGEWKTLSTFRTVLALGRPEHVAVVRRIFAGDAGAIASAADDAAKSRACSNVASQRGEAPGALEIVEEAIAELDAGRIDAAEARLRAFVAEAMLRVPAVT